MAGDIHLSLLDQIEIASPCNARWEDMAGDAVTRHCDECDLDVHNLSEMTRDAAEAFLRERAGDDRICTRIYRRSDGTILTRDCPVGFAALRARARRTAVRMAAAFVALISATAFAQWRGSRHEDYLLEGNASISQYSAFERIRQWLRPSSIAPSIRAYNGKMIMRLSSQTTPTPVNSTGDDSNADSCTAQE